MRIAQSSPSIRNHKKLKPALSLNDNSFAFSETIIAVVIFDFRWLIRIQPNPKWHKLSFAHPLSESVGNGKDEQPHNEGEGKKDSVEYVPDIR